MDRVVELDFQKSAVGYKNITMNDNFFTGHFPERAIMPGAEWGLGLRAPSWQVADQCVRGAWHVECTA